MPDHEPSHNLSVRPRRLRRTPELRSLMRETELNCDDLAGILFLKPGEAISAEVPSMPGVYQMSVDVAVEQARRLRELGVKAVMLFGIPSEKNALGTDAYNHNGIVQQGLRAIKAAVPDMLLISDICCCEYTDHGHCGVVNDRTGRIDVDNDETLSLLAKQAKAHAEAGADVLAPSGNIDGMVGAIRKSLDEHGFEHLPILSYAIKYASNLYGPFRDAAEGAPQFGDRKTYQMDPGNSGEALREAALDVEEGADLLMVKPASFYLDIIHQITTQFPQIPCAAYQVSGEYAMIKAAAANGWLDEKTVALESLMSIKRAGARLIFTYYAEQAAQWIRQAHSISNI